MDYSASDVGRSDIVHKEVVAQSATRSVIAQSDDVLGIVGFGLYLAWFYLTMTCSIVKGAAMQQELETQLVFAFLAGEAAAAVVFAVS